jgi:HD-like signal output (HDOD) protein
MSVRNGSSCKQWATGNVIFWKSDNALKAWVNFQLLKDQRLSTNEHGKTILATPGEVMSASLPDTGPQVARGSLDALLHVIQKSPEFPAFSANIRELLAILENPYLTVYDVSRVILRDVSLTTQVLKLVNTIYFQAYNRHVHTVSSAVMLIGFSCIRDLAIGLRLFENFQQSDALHQTQQLILQSFFTAISAQELVRFDSRFEHEEIFITALLFDFGELVAAYYLPKDYQSILKLAAEENLSKEAAARKILRVSLQELGERILEIWNLPKAFLERLARLRQHNLKAGTSEERLRRLLLGARNLAQSLAEPDLDQEKWEKQATRLCHSMQLPSEVLNKFLEASTQRFQELAQIVGLNLKEVGMALPLDPKNQAEDKGSSKSIPTEKLTKEALETRQGKSAPAEKEMQELNFLFQVVEEINQAIAAKSPIHQITMMILEGIFRCLRFDRVVFCLVDPKRTWVTGRFGLGDRVETLIPLLRAPLTAMTNALSLALQEHREVLIDRNARPEDGRLMEESFWQNSATVIGLVTPIQVGSTPIGAIYVDRLAPHPPISDLERQRIQTFRDLAIISIRVSKS